MENKCINCKNCDCPYNTEYETKDKQNGECKILTENDLLNRKTCEEREF